MIDFRNVIIIEKSETYENLVEINNINRKKNYFLVCLIVSSIIIVTIIAYLEEQKKEQFIE